MTHLKLIDGRGERKICREHRVVFSGKRCSKCDELRANADRAYQAFLKCREWNEMRRNQRAV